MEGVEMGWGLRAAECGVWGGGGLVSHRVECQDKSPSDRQKRRSQVRCVGGEGVELPP